MEGGGGIISDENYGSREPCEKGLWGKGIVGKGNFGKRELWENVLRAGRITLAKLNEIVLLRVLTLQYGIRT